MAEEAPVGVQGGPDATSVFDQAREGTLADAANQDNTVAPKFFGFGPVRKEFEGMKTIFAINPMYVMPAATILMIVIMVTSIAEGKDFTLGISIVAMLAGIYAIINAVLGPGSKI